MNRGVPIVFLICLCQLLPSQEVGFKDIGFTRVAVFPGGDGLGEFGLAPNQGFDGALLASSIVWTGPTSRAIFDSVNGRMVILDERWSAIRAFPIGNTGPSKFSSSRIGLIEQFGQHEPRLIRPDLGLITSLQPQILGNFSSGYGAGNYSFLFLYQDVLISQNHAGGLKNLPASFFGIKGLATTKDAKQEYLDDAAVRKLLADPKNTRYQVNGNLILDRGQVISTDDEGTLKFFTERGRTDTGGASSFGSDLQPLANGLYFTSRGPNWTATRDEKGNRVTTIYFQDVDESIYYSGFFPAPDGYIYQLRGDYKAGETRLYRIGPYPELKLDYHGKGGTINDNNVNLREDPNTKAGVVMQLSKETPVRIMDQTTKEETIAGQKGVWYLVRLWDRTEGWVFGAFLDVGRMP